MLHFTPVQKRGASGSAYSIWDQLTLDPELFRGDADVIQASDAAAERTLEHVRGLREKTEVRAAVEEAAETVLEDLKRAGWSGSGSGSSVSVFHRLSGTPPGIKTRVLRLALGRIYDWLKHGEARKVQVAEEARLAMTPGASSGKADEGSRGSGSGGASTRAVAEYDPDLDGEVEAVKQRKLTSAILQLETGGGCLSMVDIVLNHTAADSAWLGRHPEAGYSLTNSPALRAAAAFDTQLLRFSCEVARGDHAGDGVPAAMSSADVVNRAADLARDTAPKAIRLWEYYVADAETECAAMLAWATGQFGSRQRHGQSSSVPMPSAGIDEKSVIGAGTAVFTPADVPFESRVDAVICDPLYGRGAQALGRRALDDVIATAGGSGGNSEEFGESTGDDEMDSMVNQLWDSGAVWNDGSGGRYPVHVAPDELAAAAQSHLGHTMPKGVPVVDVKALRAFASGTKKTMRSGDEGISEDVSVSAYRTISLLRRVVATVNLRLYKQYDFDLDKAFGAIRGAALHSWLGQRSGRESVSLKHPLVYSYFARVGRTPVSEEEASVFLSSRTEFCVPVAETGVKGHCLACNGFIWGGESGIDFTLPYDTISEYVAILNRKKNMSFESGDEVADQKKKHKAQRGACGRDGTMAGAAPSQLSVGEEEGGPGLETSEIALSRATDWEEDDAGAGTLRRITTPTESEMDQLSSRAFGAVAAAAGTGTRTGREDSTGGPAGDGGNGIAGSDAASVSDPFSVAHRRMSSISEAVPGRASEHGYEDTSGFNTDGSYLYPFPYSFRSAIHGALDEGQTHGAENKTGEHKADSGTRRTAALATRHQRVRIMSRDGQMLHAPTDLRIPICNASTPYVRRSLVIWGDCVKLRYGRYPMDSPWLWAQMTEYTQRMASVFQAFRIDNCHGTPIHVAESMLDAARAVRPSLYVNAELFTGNRDMDIAYILRLGINSLVQEAIQTRDAGGMIGKVSEGGGHPIGSLEDSRASVRELLPAHVPGILFDCTHDNEAPAKARSARWALPTLAVTSMCAGACGSVRGFDECVPSNPSVVSDHRLYARPPPEAELLTSCDPSFPDSELRLDVIQSIGAAQKRRSPAEGHEDKEVFLSDEAFPRCTGAVATLLEGGTSPSGLGIFRLAMTRLRLFLGRTGFDEIHVECHASPGTPGTDVQVVYRGHPSRPLTYVLLARQAWDGRAVSADESGAEHIRLRLEGRLSAVVVAGRCDVQAWGIRNSAPIGPDEPRRARVEAADSALASAAGKVQSDDDTQSFGMRARGSFSAWRHDMGVLNGYMAPSVLAIERKFANTIGLTLAATSGNKHSEQPDEARTHAMFGVSSDSATPARGGANDSLGMLQSFECVEAGNGAAEGTIVTDLILCRQNFQPGSMMIVRLDTAETPSLEHKDSDQSNTSDDEPPSLADLRSCLVESESVSLADLTVLLYRAEPEEKDDSGGARGCYGLPGSGLLPWAGVMGLFRPLVHMARWNDTGHSVCENLRQGMWLAEYMVDRVGRREALQPAAAWLRAWFRRVRGMQPGLRPQGFERVVRAFIAMALAAVFRRMQGSPLLQLARDSQDRAMVRTHRARHTPAVAVDTSATTAFDPYLSRIAGADSGGHQLDSDLSTLSSINDALFAAIRSNKGDAGPPGILRLPYDHSLLLSSVMLFAEQPSAPLVDGNLPVMRSHQEVEEGSDRFEGCSGSLAAGVDHFCTGFMRSWGRDTFISLRGLLLVPGRWSDARDTILAFASVLRHGLIPNLMDGARNPRYNARDATWFWLQAIKDYCLMAPQGTEILSEKVRRRFPSDDQQDYYSDAVHGGLQVPRAGWADPVSLGEIVLEAISKHANGIDFTEWNAGPGIDAHMKAEGFHVQVRHCHETGLLLGGSPHNCGTWMDKMGEAPSHGTEGVPATPRDGAPVEISCLQYSVIAWLARLSAAGDPHSPSDGVNMLLSTGDGEAKHGRRDGDGRGWGAMPEWAAATAGDPAVDCVLKEPKWDRVVRQQAESQPGSKRGGATKENHDQRASASASRKEPSMHRLRFEAWAGQLLRSFERCFWVPASRSSSSSDESIGGPASPSSASTSTSLKGGRGIYCPDAECAVDDSLTNARGVYKDTYGGSAGWTDYQLRPNFAVGMAVAPELFTGSRARRALATFERQLLGDSPGQVGVSTLCPSDWAYQPDYDNNDQTARQTAKGWNYHQGPEWVWPFGYYLRARLRFQPTSTTAGDSEGEAGGEWDSAQAVRWVRARQERHREMVEESEHQGLPELTNSGGKHCPGSCVVQAWSSSSLLDALLDAYLC